MLARVWFRNFGEARQARFRSARARSLLQRRGVNFTVRSDGEGHLENRDAPASGRAAKHDAEWRSALEFFTMHSTATPWALTTSVNRTELFLFMLPRRGFVQIGETIVLAPRKGSQTVLHDAVRSSPWELAGSVVLRPCHTVSSRRRSGQGFPGGRL